MTIVKNQSDLVLNNLILYSQEIFSFHQKDGAAQVTKINYKNLNYFFTNIVVFRTISLWKGLFITFIMNLLATIIIYLASSRQFLLGFYYLPIGFVATFLWGKIKKSQIQIKQQLCINTISFLIFGSIFFCIYFIIYHPIIHQQFEEADECAIEYQTQVELGENQNELYSILTISFIDSEGESQIGCGCISSRSSASILSNSPFPYVYLEKSQRISTFNIDSPLYEASERKLPSWLCSGDLNSIIAEQAQISNGSLTKTKLKQCYYNNYFEFDYPSNQKLGKDFCLQQKNFLQVTFQERPYYDTVFLHLITAIIYQCFWSYSFIWPSIMITFLISRFLRKRKEQKALQQQAKIQRSQIIPDNSISINQGQNIADNSKNISLKDQNFVQPSISNFDNSYLDQYSPTKVLKDKSKTQNKVANFKEFVSFQRQKKNQQQTN